MVGTARGPVGALAGQKKNPDRARIHRRLGRWRVPAAQPIDGTASRIGGPPRGRDGKKNRRVGKRSFFPFPNPPERARMPGGKPAPIPPAPRHDGVPAIAHGVETQPIALVRPTNPCQHVAQGMTVVEPSHREGREGDLRRHVGTVSQLGSIDIGRRVQLRGRKSWSDRRLTVRRGLPVRRVPGRLSRCEIHPCRISRCCRRDCDRDPSLQRRVAGLLPADLAFRSSLAEQAPEDAPGRSAIATYKNTVVPLRRGSVAVPHEGRWRHARPRRSTPLPPPPSRRPADEVVLTRNRPEAQILQRPHHSSSVAWGSS
jgi:hypothetical protein